MATLTDDERQEIITEVTQSIVRGGMFADASLNSQVSSLDGWRKKMDADGSLGRVFNGPQWLDRVAIRDGAVNASKVAATFVIANTFTTADITVTPTADRLELTANGIAAYGTVSAVANTKTLEIKNNGDFTFGTTNPITYVASTGVLTVPAAVIGSLTIANVGAGIIGGLYKTSASNAHLELDTAGIRAYNTSAVKTFDMVASSGALNLTGSLTVGTGGKINFGVGPDYLDNNLLHFEVGSSEYGKIEFLNGSVTPRGRFTGSSSTSGATASMYTNYDGTFNGAGQISVAPNTESYVQVGSSSTGAYAQMSGTITTAAGRAKVTAQGATTVANTYVEMLAGTYGKLYIDNDSGSAYGRIQIAGRLYPGTDTSTQTTSYLYASGSDTIVHNAYLGLVAGVYGTGGTGALPNPTKVIAFREMAGGALVYVPAYSAFAGWTA